MHRAAHAAAWPGAVCCLYLMREHPELEAMELPLQYQYDAL